MQNILIVVDMQNDFIDGALGTAEAQKIVPNVAQKIRDFSGKIIFTRDTHEENYMETQEGKTSGSSLHPWNRRMANIFRAAGLLQRAADRQAYLWFVRACGITCGRK